MSRYITWGLAFVALVLAMLVTVFLPSHTIFWFAVFGMSGITATFSPMVLLGLFWRGYSSAGAVASMVSGFRWFWQVSSGYNNWMAAESISRLWKACHRLLSCH